MLVKIQMNRFVFFHCEHLAFQVKKNAINHKTFFSPFIPWIARCVHLQRAENLPRRKLIAKTTHFLKLAINQKYFLRSDVVEMEQKRKEKKVKQLVT